MAYSNISGKGKESKDYPNVGIEKEIYKSLKKLVGKKDWIHIQKAFGIDNYWIDIYSDGKTYEYNNPIGLSSIATQINFSNYIRKMKGFDVGIEDMRNGIYKIRRV
jgi:hypothetical protein